LTIRNLLLLAAVLVATSVVGLLGQASDQKPLAFEVASVKSNDSGTTAMRIIWPRGRFSAVNVTPRQFVEAAYKVDPFRVEGGPTWLTASRFNIEATIPANAVIADARGMPDAIRFMMQRLLSERFAFAAHWEKKPQTVYALILAKPNGTLGPNLRRSQADCASLFATRRQGSPLPPPSVCGVQRAPGKLIAGGYLMAQLADTFASVLQQVVVNRTGLDGVYDIDLTWAADQTNETAPSLFTALEEELGLKLEPTKTPVDVLVIDHVEKPTPD
jgi:uncharacterized protein (TIGR03435 family)